MSWTTTLRKAARRSPLENRLLAESILWLGVARMLILTTRFHRAIRLIGLVPGDSPESLPGEQVEVARTLGWAIHAATVKMPWENVCLGQALAGLVILRNRAIPATLYLGVARKDGTETLTAHAWLRCGDAVITGDDARAGYTPIAQYTWLRPTEMKSE